MEDSGGGDFSNRRLPWNPPQSPSSGGGGENSPPETSASLFYHADSVAPYSFDQTLDGGSSLGRSLEDDFRRLCSLPSSSRSDELGLAFDSRRPYGSGFVKQNRRGYDVDDLFLNSQADSRSLPVEFSPLSLSRRPESLGRNILPYSSPNLIDGPLFIAGDNSRSSSPGLTSYNMIPESICKAQKLSSLRGKVVALAMGLEGSQILQDSIELAESHSELDFVLPEVVANIGALVINPFGNFVVQKLIERSNELQRTKIVWALSYNSLQLFNICLSTHGTRVVQKLLEVMNPRSHLQVGALVGALTPFTVALTKSSNGHHVIQHCLRHFPDRYIEKILNEVAQCCIEIAMDKSGCCVLQLCVEYSKGLIKEFIVREIIANVVHLSQDRYGNYVVQHLLLRKMPNVTACLLRSLEGNYTCLSMSKYGSNVVEKCLKECDVGQVSRIIAELISDPRVEMLFVDPYGNYVIQSALEASKGIVRTTLVEIVKSNVPVMKSNIYGKKILFWLQKKNLLPTQ